MFLTLAWLIIATTRETIALGPPPRAPAGTSAPSEELNAGEDLFNIFAEQEDIISSATRKEQRLSDAPAKLIVIGTEHFASRGYRHLIDVFRDLPGYQATYESSAEFGTSLMVRGLRGNHRLVFLVNGVRYNPPGGEDVPLFENFPLAFIDRIEVMYGPGSALYGNDAFNGVINIITVPKVKNDAATVSGLYGLYNRGEAAATLATGIGPVRLELGGHFTTRDHANIYNLYPDDYRYRTVFDGPGVRLDQIPSTQLALKDFKAKERGFDFFVHAELSGLELQYYGRTYRLSSSWDRLASGAPFVSQADFGDVQHLVSATHHFQYKLLTATTSLAYNTYSILPESRFIYPVNLAQGSFGSEYRGARSSGLRFEEKLDFAFVPDLLETTFGGLIQDVSVTHLSREKGPWRPGENVVSQAEQYAYRYYTGAGDVISADTNGFVYSPNYNLLTAPIEVLSTSAIQYFTGALYGQLQWLPSTYFQLTAGVRWDYSSRFGSTINPRLAIVSSPARPTVLKLFYGRAYLEPTPHEVDAVFATNNQLLVPNPKIKPETLDSLELVWQQDIGAHVRATTSAYVNYVYNFINEDTWTRKYVYLEVDTRLRRMELLQSLNSGSGLYYGGESVINYNVWRIKTYASASLVLGRVNALTGRGETVSGSPRGVSKLSVKAGFDIEIVPNLVFDARGTFYTTPNIDFASSAYPFATDARAFFLLDANLRYTLAPLFTKRDRLSLFISGLNLTNARYKLDSGRPSINPVGTPQPPLTFMGGVEYSFGL